MAIKIEEISGNPMRFYIQEGENRRKIFSLFNAASDLSLALHTYLDTDYEAEIRLNEKPVDGMSFKISDAEKKEGVTHKTNFHLSGIVTQKTKDNKRTTIDTKSMAFSQIPDAITLFVHQPTDISKYPLIRDSKDYHEINQGNVNLLPPSIQVVLTKKNYDYLKDLTTKSEYAIYKNTQLFSKLDLDLCIIISRHSTGEYAKHTNTIIIQY